MVSLSSELLADLGGWAALKEARGLVERGKVTGLQREDATLRGRVQGAEKSCDAQIVLAERISDVEVRCTCVESRRSGRVCAHALAVGLAFLQPRLTTPTHPVLASGKAAPIGPRRWLLQEAPKGVPTVELTFLLPLNLSEALGRDSVRVILEARIRNENQPWDAIGRELGAGYAVSEEDLRALTSLENLTGEVQGVNMIPRVKVADFFRSLANHPRTWIGKKQQVTIRSTGTRPQIIFGLQSDGSMELEMETGPIRTGAGLPLDGWSFDGRELLEQVKAPTGFSGGRRIIPRSQIPDFLTREGPLLEQVCDLVPAAGFEDLQMETAQPLIEAQLEGALSGLTLNLFARYGQEAYPLGGNGGPSDAGRYQPDPRQALRFWRRDLRVEAEVLAQVEAAGFGRGKDTTFSLTRENRVAQFLANQLPRWRESWTVVFGARLESTLREIDFAEPEFSLRGGSGEDWLSLDVKLSVGGKPVSLDEAEVQRWLQTGQTHARMPDRRVLILPTAAWSEMREVLADCAVEQEPGKIRVDRTYAPFVAGALSAQGFRATQNDAAETRPPDVQGKLDPQLWQQLRAYQTQGVEWLAELAQRRAHGLLADDMGLGKTLQALCFLSWLQATRKDPAPSLVVCPTSLVTNWLREAAKFTPHLRTLDLTGKDRQEKFQQRGNFDLLVTSYAILRRDIDLYRAHEFSLVVLDEAQHIKNRGSQNAQSAKALRSRHRLILTGTPLENSVLDLWSLYDFLLPGYLGTATDFRERYETPLARGQDPQVMARLRRRVKPYFLRRTKTEVLHDLPPKLEHLTLCELSDEQREVYRAVLAQGRRDVFEKSGKSGGGRDRIAVLTTLLRLRQVSCHLGLLPQGDPARVWREPSAKMERTFELIDEAVDGGHRVLLFSQFVRALHLLREEAGRREFRFCYLDGQTKDRQAEVDRFQNQSDIPLFFISLKAGGTGLNLTGADTVIHFDPWWNPAVEEQATARAHRLGQSRGVQAYKLIAAGTVEEKIQALQTRKRELFQASMGDDAFVENLSGDELEELLAD